MTDERTEQLRQVTIEATYLKQLAFASPQAPQVFTGSADAENFLNLRSTNAEIDPERVEVTLIVAVKGVAAEETIFNVEVAQAGVFMIKGYTPAERVEILGRVCPEILYPFARSTITSAAAKGGFPNVLPKTLDFDSLFAENMREKAAAAAAT